MKQDLLNFLTEGHIFRLKVDNNYIKLNKKFMFDQIAQIFVTNIHQEYYQCTYLYS